MGLAAFTQALNQGHPWIGVLIGAGLAAVFGVVWPAMFSVGQKRKAREKNPSATEEELWDLDPSRSLQVRLSASEAFDLALEAVRALIRGRITEKNKESGVIRAWTWDTRLRIEIRPLGPAMTEIVIESHARGLQRFDDGKNLNNVLRISQWIQQRTTSAG